MGVSSNLLTSLTILLLGLVFMPSLSDAQCTAGEIGCKDCYSWCPNHISLCGEEIVGRYCPKSCGTAVSCGIDACIDMKCQDRCIYNATDKTSKCDCFNGYKLGSDGISCLDIDECETPNVCQNVEGKPFEACRNTPGGFACSACPKSASGPKKIGYYQQNGCCSIDDAATCGRSTTNTGRVVDGVDTDIEKWPWQVYIKVRNQVCGGSLISDRWIVTAGHCLVGIGVQDLSVLTIVAGVTHTVNQTSLHHQTRDAAQVIVHPQYTNLRNDVALVRVTTPFFFGRYVSPICLPNGERPQPGDTCFATGYGTTSYGGNLAVQLQEVALPVVDYQTCNQSFTGTTHTINPDTMICAGYKTGGKDSCQGDSGGPYVCQRCKNCDWYLAGSTSFGISCAVAGRYGVYADITTFETWIAQQTQQVTVDTSHANCGTPYWLQWESWSSCSKTCDSGTRSRYRTCQDGIKGRGNCLGEDFQSETCNTGSCEQEYWGEWTQWTQCSQTCGSVSRTRQRSCINGQVGDPGCPGSQIDQAPCGPVICPAWGPWTVWTTCSKTCGGGKSTRNRTCVNGTPGQSGCVGAATGEKDCNSNLCPYWSQYTWGTCSKTCGEGSQTGTRTCINGNVGQIGCEGSDTRTRTCTIEACPNEWSQWTPCSLTCGGGTRSRTRNGNTQSEACNEMECPKWGDWSKWTTCSKTCEGGTQTGTRTCLFGNVGDLGCRGKNTRSRPCRTQSCPVWGKWTEWSTCSKTCGGGMQTATRVCVNGTVGDIGCQGATSRNQNCETQTCPSWGSWTAWGSCDATCGGGSQFATRQCRNGNVGQDGCNGNRRRRQNCAEADCPVFTTWSSYGPCDKPCGPGKKTRTRTCPQPGLCPADEHGLVLTQTADCQAAVCQWNPWGPYGDCSVTCGTGTKTRTRTCNGGPGKCPGEATSSDECTLADCPTGPCAGLTNVNTDQACSTFSSQGYCITLRVYMQNNCALECCLHDNRCQDVYLSSVCEFYALYCGSHAFMQTNCQKTCNFC